MKPFGQSRPQTIPAPQSTLPTASLLLPATDQPQSPLANANTQPAVNYIDIFRACLDNAVGARCDTKALSPDDRKRVFLSGYAQQSAAAAASGAASTTPAVSQLSSPVSPLD